MNAGLIVRGIGGLVLGACGAYLLLNGMLLSFFSYANNSGQQFLVHVPGAPVTSDISSSHDGVGIACLFLLAAGAALLIWGLRQLVYVFANATHETHQEIKSVEDRLDELERLKRREMVTMEEYAAKRAEILKDL